MKSEKLSYLLILFLSFCTQNKTEDSLLWKISGKDLEAPSFLFGTWHGDGSLKGGSFLDSIPKVYETLNSVSQFIGESYITNTDSSALKAIIMPNDTTYRDLLNDKDIQILDSVLNKYMNTTSEKLNIRPILLQFVLAEKIWIEKRKTKLIKEALEEKIVPKDYYEQLDALEFGDIMDVYLRKKAQKNACTIVSLDNISNTIWTPITSLKGEVDTLLAFISNIDTTYTMIGSALDPFILAYKNQKLSEIEKYSDKMQEIFGVKLSEDVSEGRNLKWMEHIPSLIKEKPSFIAVGARHLPGKYGLINLLRKEGYIVEPVK
jgi:uncharacterized protein YbaP (TraB family)